MIATPSELAYRPFDPPERLDFDGWTRKEARAYFDWFVGQIPERLYELRRVVAAADADCELDGSPDSLACLGEPFLGWVTTRPRTPDEKAEAYADLPEHPQGAVEVEDWELTEETLSLCVDVGIYFGEVFRAAHPQIEWQLWTRKSVGHHRPVLVGAQGNVPLDPINIATNIAFGTARGRGRPGRLRELFDVWSDDVERAG